MAAENNLYGVATPGIHVKPVLQKAGKEGSTLVRMRTQTHDKVKEFCEYNDIKQISLIDVAIWDWFTNNVPEYVEDHENNWRQQAVDITLDNIYPKLVESLENGCTNFRETVKWIIGDNFPDTHLNVIEATSAAVTIAAFKAHENGLLNAETFMQDKYSEAQQIRQSWETFNKKAN